MQDEEQHGLIFQDLGFTVYEHCFWNSKELCMDPDMFLNVVKQAPHGCVFVIGNMGNCKLTQCQWEKLMATMKKKQIFPFFDIPSQGLFTGDVEEDTRFLQYFVSGGLEFFCSQSLSKNFGIYGMGTLLFFEAGGRVTGKALVGVEDTENEAVSPNAADEGVGLLVVVALNNQLLLCVLSQLVKLALALWLNPPTCGARIITSILCNSALQEAWKQSLKEIVEDIMLIKEKVKEKLRLLGTPGSWDHITNQSGTHCYLGLNLPQVEYMVKKKHVYIPKNSRINFTCINACNIDYITESINEAILFTKDSKLSSERK
ncbi:putative aspartate aminotransferase, cytoplasmic 2 [Phyllostomus hastatus]|uniref:putative aspartate aminotransferase, cytoplasmic 2 n=1 Tax=Phyllostomus hastatus TaxID=9423 RepID=UPI001E67EB8E|nr:putative aspartate aminotransferase, cytoplasmic 2 [Phyllostomus hastatus]